MHYYLKEHLFKQGLAGSPMFDRCQQAFEMGVLTCPLWL